jgi:hypothetical protein
MPINVCVQSAATGSYRTVAALHSKPASGRSTGELLIYVKSANGRPHHPKTTDAHHTLASTRDDSASESVFYALSNFLSACINFVAAALAVT